MPFFSLLGRRNKKELAAPNGAHVARERLTQLLRQDRLSVAVPNIHYRLSEIERDTLNALEKHIKARGGGDISTKIVYEKEIVRLFVEVNIISHDGIFDKGDDFEGS